VARFIYFVIYLKFKVNESGGWGIGHVTGDRGCFPVQPRDGGCGEVFGVRDCEGGVDRSRGWDEVV